MPLKRIEAANFTVFEDISIDFCKGLNVFIGETGYGIYYSHEKMGCRG